MRAELARALLALVETRTDLVFITADVGFRVFERLAERLGERFVNAGVAEQNAVAVAAGLAREGLQPWFYSIAPFTVLRPYEQIRHCVALHGLPVKLVGSGGGYGYGIMGATHHALEDVGAMRVLPNLRIYVPLVATDVAQAVATMAEDPWPNYLRLNAPAELPGKIPDFAPWRRLKRGRGAVVVGMGPVLQGLWQMDAAELLDELEVWSVGSFPLEPVPAELAASITATRRLITMEEHYRACGLAEALSYELVAAKLYPESLTALHASGYPSGRYGSQRFHQEENGLAGRALAARLEAALRG